MQINWHNLCLTALTVDSNAPGGALLWTEEARTLGVIQGVRARATLENQAISAGKSWLKNGSQECTKKSCLHLFFFNFIYKAHSKTAELLPLLFARRIESFLSLKALASKATDREA